MGKIKYIGPATFDKEGRADQPRQEAGIDEAGGQFVVAKLGEPKQGSLDARRPVPSDLSPEPAPHVDADAAAEPSHPWDGVSASNARQNSFYADLDEKGLNDRADITSGNGFSRFDGESEPVAVEPMSFEPLDVDDAALLGFAHAAFPEFRHEIVAAEEPILWGDGRYGALVTIEVEDPDGHPLEYADHPNHSDRYDPVDHYEHAMKYTNRGLTRVYVNFDAPAS